MTELWMDVIGYEGIYKVSNLGRIKSLDRLDASNHKLTGRELKQKTNRGGYSQVTLFKNSSRKTVSVHRVVASCFVPNPSDYPVINHKDENKLNNKVANLEWCSQKYNANYGSRNKRIIRDRKKAVVGTHVKTGEKIKFESIREAERNGFFSSNVSKCCRGEYKSSDGKTLISINGKRYKGYEWNYL